MLQEAEVMSSLIILKGENFNARTKRTCHCLQFVIVYDYSSLSSVLSSPPEHLHCAIVSLGTIVDKQILLDRMKTLKLPPYQGLGELTHPYHI